MDVQVAVVVVSYNTRELLLKCVSSVFESTTGRSIELVIVDNASEDGSYDAVRNAYPEATTIRNNTNLGFGAACNQGIRATRSDFILLLNSDARLTPQAYQSLCDCLEQNRRCGAAGCRLVDPAGVEVINTRNFLTGLNQAFELAGITFASGRLGRTRLPNPNGDLVDCSVDWIEGACLMLRRSALDESGLFDEQFFMYSEDEDLCLRLRKRGWLVCFCGGGTAVHHGAGSSRQRKNEMLRHFYQSQMLFLTKHRGRRSAVLYKIVMKTVLLCKRFLLSDRNRREIAGEQLNALRQACLLVGAKGS